MGTGIDVLRLFCRVGDAVDTYLLWNADYSDFAVVAWLFMLSFGWMAVILSRRMLGTQSPEFNHSQEKF